ncbi:uncharacterized protein LOC123309846 [Coccinella septempunctata]|uniref:uncharacterized protein LOC123309846 n=1 Tax=Coccinella septempunctata TaxID=41139 RepID=UPI001D08A079|nr:uncharacterized protein LOC123309846 [Coccinella septempunctata]XP_044749068.1 uncharacterized protein LOC123309846 [Coccinella septempunctata]XP_044749069.1 uncharacterized protein LOC123309846 [Coccinella septempunctata]
MPNDEPPTPPKMHIAPVIFVVVGFCLNTAMSVCPSLCECKWKSGKETVICLNANLSHVPLHLDSGTQVINLTGNNFPVLKDEEFSRAGLLNLQKIFLSRCRLRALQQYAFKNLKNLVELDLSVNFLSAIPSHTFDSIYELRELKLTDNPIQRLTNEAFISVPQLMRLELNDCKITEVEPRAFVGLERSLEWLKLDGNKLTGIEAASLTRLENLHGLELAGNSWNCSCALRPLRDWMLRANVPFGVPPLCSSPSRLKGKSWEKLDLDEFACVPEIAPSDTVTHGVEGKNVTITCRIAGIPEPNVRWTLRNKLIANLTGPSYANGKKMYVMQVQNDSSDLTIFSADVQDAGVYVCSAENKAGRVEASVTLAVSRRPPDQTISVKVLLLSASVGIMMVITLCSVSLCLCSRKKTGKWRTRECAREENYEKIELNHKVSDKNGGVQKGEISVVNRRNGDYSVVPAADTDQELEDEETSTLDIASRSSQWDKEKKWGSPDNLQNMDMQIPRQNPAGTRDDHPQITTSTSGTFNKSKDVSPSPITHCYSQMTRGSPEGDGIPSSCASTTRPSKAPAEPPRRFPDIVGTGSTNPFTYTTLGEKRGANSEGGSVNDISELFCTLPRKTRRYRSTDSEAPLLSDSRYVSSGGESYGSQESSGLRKFGDSYRYTANLNKNREKISNSYLNLCRVERPAGSQEYKATPLLNVSGLENRPARPEMFSPTSGTPNANSYDYHATQLERFLEEYRNLQKQLTKMKETCDNLRHDTNYLKSVSRTSSSDDVKRSKRAGSVDGGCSPNSNRPMGNSMDFGKVQSDLTKYLLTKSSSPKPYATSGMFNN